MKKKLLIAATAFTLLSANVWADSITPQDASDVYKLHSEMFQLRQDMLNANQSMGLPNGSRQCGAVIQNLLQSLGFTLEPMSTMDALVTLSLKMKSLEDESNVNAMITLFIKAELAASANSKKEAGSLTGDCAKNASINSFAKRISNVTDRTSSTLQAIQDRFDKPSSNQ